MDNINNRVIVLDDHYLRGAGLVSLMNSWGFNAELREATPADGDAGPQPADFDGTVACLLVVGGVSILRDDVVDLVAQYLRALEDRPLVIVSDGVDNEQIRAAVESGVRGALPTRMNSNVAMAAIRFILAGGHYFPHSYSKVERVLSWVPRRLEPVLPDSASLGGERAQAVEAQETAFENGNLKLSKRQVEVLHYLEQGLSNKAIGQELDLCEATVKIHVRQLMRKLGVGNRTQVALRATSMRTAERNHWAGRA